MDKNTQRMTTGAAVLAIFTLLILLNRQSAGFFEEVFLFIFPLPMMVFAALYGWKSSLPLMAGMAIFTFLFGNISTVFYALSEVVIGLVLGECIHRKADMTKTLFAVMILSSISTILNTIVFAGLFGVDLNVEVREMQEMLNRMLASAGMTVPAGMLSTDYLKQLMVIAMAVTGILEGFVVFQLSVLLLRRLHYQVERPKSIYLYFPPKWTGMAAMAAFLAYYTSMIRPFQNEQLRDIIQAAGICGNIFLSIFGFIAIMFYVRIYLRKSRWLGLLFCFLIYYLIPIGELVIGFVYVVTNYHWQLLVTGNQRQAQQERTDDRNGYE